MNCQALRGCGEQSIGLSKLQGWNLPPWAGSPPWRKRWWNSLTVIPIRWKWYFLLEQSFTPVPHFIFQITFERSGHWHSTMYMLSICDVKYIYDQYRYPYIWIITKIIWLGNQLSGHKSTHTSQLFAYIVYSRHSSTCPKISKGKRTFTTTKNWTMCTFLKLCLR